MPRKSVAPLTTTSDHFFVKELASEIPPSFEALKSLYEQASDLYGLRPWRVLDESQLILVRDSVSGELCYYQRENPRLCRGGSSSLTFTGIVPGL
jgi:hypothetical protein